jgi:hypothetical protein
MYVSSFLLIFLKCNLTCPQVVKVLDSDAEGLPNIASPELDNHDYSMVGDIVSVSTYFAFSLD